jgi:hypothetical protein
MIIFSYYGNNPLKKQLSVWFNFLHYNNPSFKINLKSFFFFQEEIDLRLMGNITQISITPATPISTSPSKMEFPSPNGFAGETENGEEDGENSSENSSVNGGEIELNHRHPEENDEVPESHNLLKGEPPKRRIESTENSSNSTAAAVVIPVIVSNGGQRFGSNVEQAIITVDTPLLQKEDENVELVSSC